MDVHPTGRPPAGRPLRPAGSLTPAGARAAATARLGVSVSRLLRFVAIDGGQRPGDHGARSPAWRRSGFGLVHHTATADAMPLPPLGSQAALGGSTVYAADGTTVLARPHGVSGPQAGRPVARCRKVLITAVLDTEDHRFFVHGGFDIPSTIRALAADSSGSGGIQGGSTIAQQLVKQTYLTSQRKLSRKIKEAVLADRLERKYTKNQILQAYLNTIYLGNGAYGVEAAANVYFGEHATPAHPAAGGPAGRPDPGPERLRPHLRPRRCPYPAQPRSWPAWLHYGDITAAQAAAADRTPLPTSIVPARRSAATRSATTTSSEVQTELLGASSPLGSTYDQRYQALFEGGLKIYTNLQPDHAGRRPSRPSRRTPRPTARVSSRPWSPSTRPRARCGPWSAAPGLQNSQFDIITQGTRQPGSGFKLFTLLAAPARGLLRLRHRRRPSRPAPSTFPATTTS